MHFSYFFLRCSFVKFWWAHAGKMLGHYNLSQDCLGFSNRWGEKTVAHQIFFLSWYLAAQEFQTILVRSCWVPLENIQFGKTSIQLTFWDGRVGQYRVWEMSIYIARISWMIFHDVPLLKYAKLGHGEISHRLVWTWGISRYPKKNDGESMLVSHHVPQ